ncbi:MAG TPA: amidohydrolase [Caulobacteraceae bacterium]|jgi:hippurate hydrolase|nr:amidohydrolase [Caulobacteraceae bacterium]
MSGPKAKLLALAAAVALMTGLPVRAFAMDVGANKAAVDRILDVEYPHLDALYKDIHQHPELGHHEVRTSTLLAKEMRDLGYEVTEHVGGTGVVAILHNGAGPTVMIRTELDALPMQEKTGLPYASTVQTDYDGKTTYVDHSCGHDIHMAAWVGTAKTLVELKSRWHGTVMFIAQPAEEDVDGAAGMIRDGLFTRFKKPDYGFALHDGPFEYGYINYKAGVFSSNSDSLDITFHGRGGHGAKPQQTIDPVLMASRFVVDVQAIVSRERDPLQMGVISIGAIQGGSAGNIIPDTVTLRGTIRSYDAKVRARMLDGVRRVAAAEAAMSGAPAPDVTIVDGGKSVVNDKALTERTAPVFKAAFGDKAVELEYPNTASEDYSEFILAGVPSVFFGIGVYSPERVAAAKAGGPPLPSNHSPEFAPVPEPTIRTGVEAMSLAVMNVLGAA